MLRSLALSLGLTLLIEIPAALILGLRRKEDILLVGLVNILTNPIIVLILNLFFVFTASPPPWFLILPLEVFAVLTEGFIYQKGLSCRRIHPFLLSLILNGISYFGGLLL